MRAPRGRFRQEPSSDPYVLARTRFVVEVCRLADGTAAGRVTVLGTGRTEEFRGWRALVALLADDQSSR